MDIIEQYYYKICQDINQKGLVPQEHSRCWSTMKSFIYNNKDHRISKDLNAWLIKKLLEYVSTEQINNVLCIPDDYKYLRDQQLYPVLPFQYDDDSLLVSYYFYKLIQNDQNDFGKHPKVFIALKKFFHSFDIYSADYNLDQMIDFWNRHDALRNSVKSIYLPYDEEINKYKQDFEGETLGHIGEYDFYERLKPFPSSIFTAKDLNNGFGFDMYYIANNIEQLVEVKSTAKIDGTDFLSLTENEYNVMMSTLNDPFVNYVVARVYVDLDYRSNNFFYTLLEFKNGHLKSYTDPYIDYVFDYVDDEKNYYFKHAKLSDERILALYKK